MNKVILSERASPLLIDMVRTLNHYDLPAEYLVLTASLDRWGRDETLYRYLHDHPDLSSHKGLLLITSENELYTKEYAKEVLHVLNRAGMEFIGHPVIEAIAELKNMRKWASYEGVSNKEALMGQVRKLAERACSDQAPPIRELLVLHANSRPERSNTMDFYRAVQNHLTLPTTQLELLDEHIQDCAGCNYRTCGYYSSIQSCYFGGSFTQNVLQAIRHADAILLLAPNYNDAMSAKLMAVANRLSVLYREGPFYQKYIFALVVSGNSGSDSVARQIIGAYNVNKGFRLPRRFYAQAIANDAGELRRAVEMEERARIFASDLMFYV